MCRSPLLRYSPMYSVMIDLNNNTVYNAKPENYGKKINLHKFKGGYFTNAGHQNMTLHRIVADACVTNPRPDIFNVVDHINGKTEDNRPENLRWVNHHINLNNRQNGGKYGPPGVELSKFRTKRGNWVVRYTFRKHGMVLFSTKNKEKVIKYAQEFKTKYLQKLYEAYVNSPTHESEEWFVYWRKYLVCREPDDVFFREEIREIWKFLVNKSLFKKLTGRKKPNERGGKKGIRTSKNGNLRGNPDENRNTAGNTG